MKRITNALSLSVNTEEMNNHAGMAACTRSQRLNRGLTLLVVGAVALLLASCDDSAGGNSATVPAKPDAPTITATSDTVLTISWNALPDATQYRLFRATTEDGTYERLAADESIPTSYTDSGLMIGTTYYYRVAACSASADDSCSVQSAVASASTRVLPTPTAPTITATSDTILTILWSEVSGATQYRLYRSITEDGTYERIAADESINTISYANNGLTLGRTYYYRVAACIGTTDASCSAQSAVASRIVAPSAPAAPTVTMTSDTVLTISWSPLPDATQTQYRLYRSTTENGTYERIAADESITATSYTDSGLTAGTTYYYRLAACSGTTDASCSAQSESAGVVPPAPAAPTITVTSGTELTLSWSPIPDATQYRLYRATTENGTYERIAADESITTTSYANSGLTAGATYYYRLVVCDGSTDISCSAQSVTVSGIVVILPVDRNNNTLVDISNLDMLNNIRHSLTLAGGRYKTSASDPGVQCGTTRTTACTGYELTNNLDFAEGASYASNSINNAWRPNAAADSSGAVVPPANGANRGWEPIGSGNSAQFTAIFEGNGYTIKNLYSRNVANINAGRTGLFGQIGESSVMRNLIIENGTVIGGNALDHIGIAIGHAMRATITNTIIRGGSANGGAGDSDRVGGLVGRNNSTISASSSSATVNVGSGSFNTAGGLAGTSFGTITASYATGNVNGGAGNSDRVGGLVGFNGSVTVASYATGDVDGGAGNTDQVGGLAGFSTAAIAASYATGSVDGGTGNEDRVGGLTGFSQDIVVASYATGDVDGGEGMSDYAGALDGYNSGGTIIASYGFGNADGEVFHDPSVIRGPSNGTDRPSGVTHPSRLTAPGTATTTATPAQWNQAINNTLSAWDFGTSTQAPALKYADYDAAADRVDYCARFPAKIPGTEIDLACNTALLPGQSALRTSRTIVFDLAVPSITTDLNSGLVGTSFTLSATVRNTSSVVAADASTLTYYRSTDATIDTSDTPLSETDAIPALNANATSDATVITTAPATGTYYYGACVSVAGAEANTTNNCSTVVQVITDDSIDSDGDTLIDINTLDMLNNIRNNLAGTFYSEIAGATSGAQCGATDTTVCTGYELMRNLDFADSTSHASNSINNAWRPNAAADSSGAVVAPANGANRGWEPIGRSDSVQFTAIFEGNGYTIKNLYSRNVANTATGRTGLFGQIGASSVMRNLVIENGIVIGGNNIDYIGIAVGFAKGATITNTIIRGGSANGGASVITRAGDLVGGLVGRNESIISASSSSATINAGSGNFNAAGGLAGSSLGTITASYATGNVDGGAGTDRVGGLVGINFRTATITASYATGNADGGEGSADYVGAIVGNNNGTITASYGFGNADGEVFYGLGVIPGPSNGTNRPSGVTLPRQLTAPGTATSTAAPSVWNQGARNTLNAWDFGTVMQAPALKYADYDAAAGTNYCASFSAKIPGTETSLSCSTTLLPYQSALRTRVLTLDLIVLSVTASPNVGIAGAGFSLLATVRNTSAAITADPTTLTYYRSTDATIDTSDTPLSETDAISALNANATGDESIMTTAPASAGTYYYGACVSTVANEGNTTNNCSTAVQVTVRTARAGGAFAISATNQNLTYNFGVGIYSRFPAVGNATFGRLGALVTVDNTLYMIANTVTRGDTDATSGTAQDNVPEFYKVDVNGKAEYRGAFIGSATPTTPGVVTQGAAILSNTLYFVGEKKGTSTTTGHLYSVPISNNQPSGLAVEIGSLALAIGTEDQPRGLAVSNANLYLTSGSGMLYTVRTNNGQLANGNKLQLNGSDITVADSARLTSALTASSDGTLYTALKSGTGTSAELYSINPTTAVMTKVGDITLEVDSGTQNATPSFTPSGLTYNGGLLYMIGGGTSAAISITGVSDQSRRDKWLYTK